MDATYITTDELATRIHYDARTIRTRLKDAVLLEGVHYIRPFGGRKLLFIWEAIQRIRAHVGAPVEHARQGDAADARGLGDFAQGDAPTLLELLGGDALLELESEH